LDPNKDTHKIVELLLGCGLGAFVVVSLLLFDKKEEKPLGILHT